VAALTGKRYFSGHEKILQDRISAPGVELPILVNPLYFDFPDTFGYKEREFFQYFFLIERKLTP